MSGNEVQNNGLTEEYVKDDDAGIVKVSFAILTIGGTLAVAIIGSALAEIIHQGWMIADVTDSEKAHDASDQRQFDDMQKQIDRRVSDLKDQLASGRRERMEAISVLERRIDDLEHRAGVERSH